MQRPDAVPDRLPLAPAGDSRQRSAVSSDPYRDCEGAADPHSTSDIRHSTFDARARKRLELVKQWRKLCDENPEVGKGILANQVAEAAGVSVRSLYAWSLKLGIEGPEGLRDRYVPAPKKVLIIDPDHAKHAVLVCAWWAFRIGNCKCIDTKMMHAAVTQLIAPGYDVADLLATIDCYYSYSCDRTRYPFKPFRRWARHDFPVPWLYRACDENDYRRGLKAARNDRVPLQTPRTTMSSSVASAQMRKRETLHGPTRRAIHSLHPSTPQPLSPSNPRPPEPASNTLQAAGMLKSMGLAGVATRVVQAAAPGIPALAASQNPQTIAEALGTLDDGYRSMLHKAAHGDREAHNQAIATMPLWWDAMPESVRNDIDFRVDAWQRQHPTATNGAVAGRKLAMLLPKLHGERTGAQRLFPAARIPV